MQIGEFARICNTRISVLRHYDKEKLLSPDYIDTFTGYRYYSKEQIADFLRITVLKDAGFSLSEIRAIISEKRTDGDILHHFERKKDELRATLKSLERAKTLLIGNVDTGRVSISGDIAKCSHLSPEDWQAACDAIEHSLAQNGYQRISVYRMEADTKGTGLKVTCRVTKLCDGLRILREDVDIPFTDDPRVVGKWETLGEFAVKEDFFSGAYPSDNSYTKRLNDIYFLPRGESYWCYSWSAGKLIIRRGGGDCSANDYTVEEHDGSVYMFIDLKSYNYRRGGTTTVLVLRQVDTVPYKIEDIAIKDDTDLPFINDPCVLGEWQACGFCEEIEDFSPRAKRLGVWAYKTMEFMEGGLLRAVYSTGATVCDQGLECWTRGYHLRKWISTKSAYEIREIEGREYLFIQWKSGDYIYGGLEPMYYVFERSGNDEKGHSSENR